MIRVCYTVDPPFLGGAEHYIGHLARGLDGARFEPSLFACPKRDGDARFDAWVSAMEADGIRVVRATVNLPFRPHTAITALRSLRQLRPHIVHVNVPGPYDGQMGLLAPLSRMAGARGVVTTEHLPMVGFLPKRALVKRFAYRFVDRILTVCEANVPYLTGRQKLPARRVRAIANGLDAAYGTGENTVAETRRRRGIPQDVPLVAFVGNLLPHKGLARVIEALSGCDAPWHLVIVGEGPDAVPAVSLLEEKGLAKRATFTGALAEDEVERVLMASDLLALPSSFEGMPYVVLEAMACSLPVVAGNVYGIPEQVVDGETGFLVEPEDIPGITDRFARLLGDAALRGRMGAAARQRFEQRFTLAEHIDRVQNVYLELAGAR